MKAVIFIASLYLRAQRRKKLREINRNINVRGERMLVQRESAPPIEVYRYLPSTEKKEPRALIINVHGGAWIHNHALVLDTESGILADRLSALVLSVNHKKVDEKAFPYAQYEIYDLVKYCIANADEMGIDVNRIVLKGCSSGAHLCACAVQMLRDDGISVSYQVLCYPFTDFTCGGGRQTEIKETLDKIKIMDKVFFTEIKKDDPLASPGINPNLKGLPPTLITTCGADSLRVQGEEYARRLSEAGIDVTLINDENAIHGYLENNYPETKKDGSKSPEQEMLCRTMLERIIAKISKTHSKIET